MTIRIGTRRILTALAFAAAGAAFAVGLTGRSGSWLVAMVASLGLLTLAFFIASGPSRDT